MSQNDPQQTTKAGLIATFYGPRDEIQPLTHQLGVTLGLVIQAFPDVPYLAYPEQGKFLRYFDPPAAHDTRVVLLALSCEGEADQAWETLCQELYQKLYQKGDGNEAILEQFTEPEQEALWGYNLIYHAALVEGSSPNQQTMNKLLPLARRPDLEPRKRAEWLAHTEVAGTQLWLMDVPNEDGVQAATVYVALSPLEKEYDMITKVLYGQRALLLMPDLIAHKSYFQIRQLTDQRREQYEGQLEELRQHIAPLLALPLPDASQTLPSRPTDLETLSKTYARLLFATSFFDDLRIALAQQLENINLWEDELGSGNITQYYKQQIHTSQRELELLIDKGRQILAVIHATIEMQQAKLAQAREERETLIAALIGILGIALAVSQLIDPDAAEALLEFFSPPHLSENRLLQLLIQLAITGIVTALAFWGYQRWRLKEMRNE